VPPQRGRGAAIGLFATTIRAARARAAASAQRAALLEREQEGATRAAVAQERARIARESGDPALLRPQPGLDQLDALIANVRAAGQPITARTVEVALPRGIDLTAYRVVQEALTNALRYAPGARTEVVVDRDGGALVVEVINDGGRPPAGEVSAGAASGLLGLAERLRLYGGTLEAGGRPGGGFRVRADIPWSRRTMISVR
jgi:signal transduction histidine kinase